MSHHSSSQEVAPDAQPPFGPSSVMPVAQALLTTLCAAMPLMGDVNTLTVAAPLVVGTISAWGTWRHLRGASNGTSAQQQADITAQAATTQGVGNLDGLLKGLLPVWHNHVAATRAQVDTAANELLGSFASISDQFEAAGFTGTAGVNSHHNETAERLQRCELDLQQVLDLMNDLMQSKEQMNASVKELGSATKDLQSMAHGVAKIAAQTNLLAINAAIEAAHAGESGRGFATIAKEIRGLSQSSEETASQISQRISRVTGIMDNTAETAEQAAQHEGTAIERSRQSVQEVLSHMRELGSDAATMRERGNVIRGDIEQLIISLQFQDRVNQQMGVIEGDMTKLREHIEQRDALPAVEQWLADLQRHYTMREQRENAGSQSASHAPQAPRKAVFF